MNKGESPFLLIFRANFNNKSIVLTLKILYNIIVT